MTGLPTFDLDREVRQPVPLRLAESLDAPMSPGQQFTGLLLQVLECRLEVAPVDDDGAPGIEVSQTLGMGTKRSLAAVPNVLDDLHGLAHGQPIGWAGAGSIHFCPGNPAQEMTHCVSFEIIGPRLIRRSLRSRTLSIPAGRTTAETLFTKEK
jgi:hypothetical protein